MTPSEIITQDAQNHGVDPEKVLQSVVGQVNSGHTIVMQENNSLLFVTRLGDHRAMVHLSTVDSHIALKQALSNFLKKLKESEIKVVYGNTINEQIIKLMKKVGAEVKKSNLPKFTWMASVE
jgi:hypothetical protein